VLLTSERLGGRRIGRSRLPASYPTRAARYLTGSLRRSERCTRQFPQQCFCAENYVTGHEASKAFTKRLEKPRA
jgi:hypothetical protein